jgi:hypothetical protein
MRRVIILLIVWLAALGQAAAADLARAPAEELLRVYAQLRQLHAGNQSAVAENVVWKRDAGTFTFKSGTLTFAAPVEGRVLAAVFEGAGTFELSPPTVVAQRQIARFGKGPKLQDEFRQAVFFFTDNSFAELEKLMAVRGGGGGGQGAIEASQKKMAENFNDWWSNVRAGNFPMRNLPARMLADLSDPSSRGFFLADFKGDRSGHLLYHISWNRDSLLLPDLSNDEEVMLLHYNLANYYEWWAGFHLAEEYARTPHPEHRTLPAHCRQNRIKAEIVKDNRLNAIAEMEFEVPGGSARLIPFNLAGVLRIASVQDGEGKNLSFIQEDRRLDNDPWLILPEPAAAGRVYKARIDYQEDSTRDSHIINRRGVGLYFVTARTSWFPSFGAYDDRTQYVLSFRSPKKYRFIATGHMTKVEKQGDWLETQWESEIPFSVVGFNYGNFVDSTRSDPALAVTAYSGNEVPDELRSVEMSIDSAELSTGAGGPRDIAGQMGMATGGFNTKLMVGQAAASSYQALKLFERYYGPLPFKNVSVTEQPVRGFGQSWPTLIFLPYDSLLDETTRHGLGFQETAEDIELYNVIAVHEMSHQWWGHLVGCKTYHDQWLSEGIAEFSAAVYLQALQPKKWNSFWNLKRKWLLMKNDQGHRPVDVGPLWLNQQTNAYLEMWNSTFLTYYKGAAVMQMLRLVMQDAKSTSPDARFVEMMKDFVSTYTGKNASTQDFQRMVEKHVGESMDWFFNQWVYGTEIPHYEFSYELKGDDPAKPVLKMSLTQSEVSDSFFMRVPVYAYINGQPRLLTFINVKGSHTVAGEIPLPFRPEKVTIDETRSILCTM